MDPFANADLQTLLWEEHQLLLMIKLSRRKCNSYANSNIDRTTFVLNSREVLLKKKMWRGRNVCTSCFRLGTFEHQSGMKGSSWGHGSGFERKRQKKCTKLVAVRPFGASLNANRGEKTCRIQPWRSRGPGMRYAVKNWKRRFLGLWWWWWWWWWIMLV